MFFSSFNIVESYETVVAEEKVVVVEEEEEELYVCPEHATALPSSKSWRLGVAIDQAMNPIIRATSQ
jgi:hypothetical protein